MLINLSRPVFGVVFFAGRVKIDLLSFEVCLEDSPFPVDRADFDHVWQPVHHTFHTPVTPRWHSPIQLPCSDPPVSSRGTSGQVEKKRKTSQGHFSVVEDVLRRTFHWWIVEGVPSQSRSHIELVINQETVLRGGSYCCTYFKLKRMHAAQKSLGYLRQCLCATLGRTLTLTSLISTSHKCKILPVISPPVTLS